MYEKRTAFQRGGRENSTKVSDSDHFHKSSNLL